MVFPHLEKVLVEQVVVVGGVLRITARTRDGVLLPCPDCGTESRRVHSRYQRHLADAAVGGRPVVIALSVRRLFCDAPDCPRRTFAGQAEGLTIRYGRCTPLLLDTLRAVGLALAGSAGARLLTVLNVSVSRVTLLSIVLALPEPVVECPRILGVDEFALKRSRRYGTVLADAETHRVIGILADYTGDTFAAWLTVHPGAEVICRDRANSFSDGARRGAPQAQQCADRFHLWQNLGTAVERASGRLRSTWLPPEREPSSTAEVLPDKDEGPLTQRNRERHAAVHALMERGVGLTGIMRELRLDPKTVRRFMRAATVEEILTHGPSGRTGVLDAHSDCLARRWDEGCTGAHILHAELAAQGIHVSKRTVRRFVHRMREHGAPTPRSLAPKAREASALILTHPDALAEPDQALLKELSTRCPDLATIRTLVEDFAEMPVNRQGDENLDNWLNSAKTSGIPELHGSANSLARDIDAVRAGLTMPWSSGVAEGHVNRIKMLKRQMFGRAGHRLLRRRVLLA
ncbi:ISL3 family transposase [Streptomyces sp. NPDC020799]|uniref:ISL3 family transposase n=1 Tax=Streptomyces sp. NPDC020799 TaxID=3365091 RepID=UPI00379D5376